jgi:hypothetical protein
MTFFVLLPRSAGAWLVPPDLGGANWRRRGARGRHELRYALLEPLELRRFEEAPGLVLSLVMRTHLVGPDVAGQ